MKCRLKDYFQTAFGCGSNDCFNTSHQGSLLQVRRARLSSRDCR
nr:MAG TPA: hypothetical protein [Caudoviricetes sp.]